MKYQLIIMGPNADRFEDPAIGPGATSLSDTLSRRIEDLGLDPAVDYETLREVDAAKIQWKGCPVGLWFGGEDTSSSDVLETLHARGAPVLPLVEDLQKFTALVPETLQPINGREWRDERIPGDVLQSFRLTPEVRQAFISYRRSDAKPVADGLFEALEARGYRVFLDTASVGAAKQFQDILWDRLADMDLMIFLDSPNALSSRWVSEELTRVNLLGLGALQLVWPFHDRFKGTDFSEPFDLDASHFEKGDFGPDGRLTAAATAAVVVKAEEVRIRSLSARRRRVVLELLDRADGLGYRHSLYPMGPIAFRGGVEASPADAPILGLALPIVGLPDAWSIHRIQKQLDKLMDFEDQGELERIDDLLKTDGVRIVYDGLGVETERAEHLLWLNDGLPMRTAWFDRSRDEKQDPLQSWLGRLGTGPEGGCA